MQNKFNMAKENSFLGRGWDFPPTFNKETKQVVMIEEEEDIRSSLEILLSTRPGERIMQPKYGCALDELSFEPLNTTMKTYIKDLIETAILYFEPRIEPLKITLEDDTFNGIVRIHIEYKVRSTNSRYNFVYPFYKNEGTKQ